MNSNISEPKFFTGKPNKPDFEDVIQFHFAPDDNLRMPNRHGIVVWKAKELSPETLVVEYHAPKEETLPVFGNPRTD